MYVRFEKPEKKDGTLITTVKNGKGTLVARAAFGPLNPAMPNVEMTSFGVWQSVDGKIAVTVPEGAGAFPHLCGKLVKSTVKQEDGPEEITLTPSVGGKQEIEKLTSAIADVYKANIAQAFAKGQRFDLPMTAEVSTSAGGNIKTKPAAA